MSFSLPVQSQEELVFILVGLVLLLGGWIVFRAGTRLLALALGAGFGFFLGEMLNVVLKVDRDVGLWITVGCSAVGGLGAVIMIRAVTNFLFALIGLLFGALMGRLGAEVYAQFHQVPFEINRDTGLAIAAVAGVTTILAVWLQRLIMILITSYMGATFLVAGVDALSIQPLAFPAVLGAGIIWQGFVLGRIFKKRKSAPKPAAAEPR